MSRVGKTISIVKNTTIYCGLHAYNTTIYGGANLKFGFVAVFRAENEDGIDENFSVG